MFRNLAALAIGAATLVSTPAFAASLTFTLVRTTPLTNVDDAAGRFQYDGGDVLLRGQDVADYQTSKRVVFGATTTNAYPVEMTILVPAGSDARFLKLEGVHSFNTGNQHGNVVAASPALPVPVGAEWTFDTLAGTLTITW